MTHVGLAPKRRHPLSRLNLVERQPLLDDGERRAHLAKRRDQSCPFELDTPVVAVANAPMLISSTAISLVLGRVAR
ncbi:MAG TPA: hypothetical protein VI365_27825 [Trebonia sp.]